MDTPERAPSPKAWGSFTGIPVAASINSPTSSSSVGATLQAQTQQGQGASATDYTSALRQISDAQQAQCQLIRQLSERLTQLEVEPHRRNSPLTPFRAPARTLEAIQALRLRPDLPSWGPKALALLEGFTANPCEDTSVTLAEGLWELLQAHLLSPPHLSSSSPSFRVANANSGSGSHSLGSSLWGGGAGAGAAGGVNVNALMSSAAHLFVGGVLGWIAIMILFSGDGK